MISVISTSSLLTARACARYCAVKRRRAYLISDDTVARRLATSGAARMTGSPMKSGAASHLASLAKTPTTSQRIFWCPQQSICEAVRCARSSFATRWFLSQNCTTRGSATRRRTRRLGRNQSVGRIENARRSGRGAADADCSGSVPRSASTVSVQSVSFFRATRIRADSRGR